ncbi:MAG: hypothetical protein NTW25_12100 [Candidatus Kapabacteria bacterium]|nr:hypothetical protein [Candidatus Kapabacteria bacterium]
MLKVKYFANLILFLTISNFVFSQTSEEINLVKQAIIEFSKKDFQKACFYFDEGLKGIMPDTITQKMWEGIIKKCGKYEYDIDIKTKQLVGQNSISITSKFEKSELISTFVTYLDSTKKPKIGAIYFLPKTKDNTHQLPTYINNKLFKVKDLTFVDIEKHKERIFYNYNEEIESSPLAIFISDIYKDENDSENDNHPFRDIAWGISSKGLSTIQVSMISNENVFNPNYLSNKLNFIYKELCKNKNIDSNNICIIAEGVSTNLLSHIKLNFNVKLYFLLNTSLKFPNKLTITIGKSKVKEFEKMEFLNFTKSNASNLYFYDTEIDSTIYNMKYSELKEYSKTNSKIRFRHYLNLDKFYCKLEDEKSNNIKIYGKFTDIQIVNDIFNVIFETK